MNFSEGGFGALVCH